MMMGSGGTRWVAAITRLAGRINRLPRRRRATRTDRRPVGPKLVVGRGAPRRRDHLTGVFSLILYIALAAGLILVLLKAWGPMGLS